MSSKLPNSYGPTYLASLSQASRLLHVTSWWAIVSPGTRILGCKVRAGYVCFYSEINDVCGLCGSREARFEPVAILDSRVALRVGGCDPPFLHYLLWDVFPMTYDTGVRVGLVLNERHLWTTLELIYQLEVSLTCVCKFTAPVRGRLVIPPSRMHSKNAARLFLHSVTSRQA